MINQKVLPTSVEPPETTPEQPQLTRVFKPLPSRVVIAKRLGITTPFYLTLLIHSRKHPSYDLYFRIKKVIWEVIKEGRNNGL